MKKLSILFLLSFLFAGLIQAQQKETINVKDLNSDITKYIKKNYAGFKTVEAYEYKLVYEIKVVKGSEGEKLVFDHEGNFVNKITGDDKSAFAMQIRSTMATKDLESNITKYINKNLPGFKVTEAYKYDEVFATKIVKGEESETLLFDKEGTFEKKITAAHPAGHSAKADSSHVAPVIPAHSETPASEKSEPMKSDTTK